MRTVLSGESESDESVILSGVRETRAAGQGVVRKT
jgi:hypothetical protein